MNLKSKIYDIVANETTPFGCHEDIIYKECGEEGDVSQTLLEMVKEGLLYQPSHRYYMVLGDLY